MIPKILGERKWYVSQRVKLLIYFTLLFTVIIAASFLWFLSYATRSVLEQVRTDLIDTLAGASAGIDGDEFNLLATSGSADDQRYLAHVEWLNHVHRLETHAYPYTYVRGTEPNSILFIGDSEDDAAGFREPYTFGDIPDSPVLGLDSLTVNMVGYTDETGSWISAYQPILDTNGNKVGAIGVDFAASYVDRVRQGVLDHVVIVFGIAYVLLFSLVVFVSGRFTRPIIALTGIAEAIGEGSYEQDFSRLTASHFPDEIVRLTAVIESMLDKIRIREETLKSQVVELQIIIDNNMQQDQVNQIVDSDFFQDLQSKAAKFRADRKSPPPE